MSVCKGFANIVVANQDGSDSLFQFHPQGFSNPINYGPLSNLEPFLFFYSMYHVRDPFFSQATTIIQLTLWVSAAPAQYHKNNDCANPIYNCRFFSSNTPIALFYFYIPYTYRKQIILAWKFKLYGMFYFAFLKSSNWYSFFLEICTILALKIHTDFCCFWKFWIFAPKLFQTFPFGKYFDINNIFTFHVH